MGQLLNMGIKMQSSAVATKTVNWAYTISGTCTGNSYQVIKNGSTISSGGPASASGSFTVVPGDVITINNTTGPKPTIGCSSANALIGTSPGIGDYVFNSNSGASVTATATYTVVSGSSDPIYMDAGNVIA